MTKRIEHEYIPGAMKGITKERHELVEQLWRQGLTYPEIAETAGLRHPEYAREILVLRGLIPEAVESDHTRRMKAWEKARQGARETLDQLLKAEE